MDSRVPEALCFNAIAADGSEGQLRQLQRKMAEAIASIHAFLMQPGDEELLKYVRVTLAESQVGMAVAEYIFGDLSDEITDVASVLAERVIEMECCLDGVEETTDAPD